MHYIYIYTYIYIYIIRIGVRGVKVKVFTTAMDTPGRAELMGAQ